jgi:hypothetical protein
VLVPKTPRYADAVMKNRHQLRETAFVETRRRGKVALEKLGQEVLKIMDPRLEGMSRKSEKRELKGSLTAPGVRT